MQANVSLSVRNADISRVEKALSKGRANLDIQIASAGNSVAQMVSSLNGKGNVVLEGLDVRGKGQGSGLAFFLDLVFGLNQVGGQLTKGGKGKGLADITGSFTIDKGVARTQDIKLLSGIGNGEATGIIDLPRWYVDVNGKVDISQNLISQILTKGKKTSTVLPFRVSGRLDAPNVKMDTSKILLSPGGLVAPLLEKVIKKKPGVGQILDQLLPGVLSPQQQQQPSHNNSNSLNNKNKKSDPRISSRICSAFVRLFEPAICFPKQNTDGAGEVALTVAIDLGNQLIEGHTSILRNRR